MPFGVYPILTTAAFVFTSYLGFAQVATIAGEIRDPGRTLPLAMVGSVVAVGILYVLTIFVATSAFGANQLASFRETAMVEVARAFVGPLGAVAILVAGLLATVSSANASILSSSRAVYALGRDSLLPEWTGRLNRQFGTPHFALSMAGGPVLVLIALGRVRVLAEVASFLHLLMYGLICIALVRIRHDDPEWYDPSFRIPGYPIVPILGALASFALVTFMLPISQLVGIVVLVTAAIWYRYYAPEVKLKGVL